MKLALALAACGFGLSISQAASATTLATCGPSDGHAYYLGDQSSGWETDRISKGHFVFTSDSAGNINLLFKDARGGTIDAAADGAEIVVTRADADAREFSILLTYPETGVTEVYNVVSKKDGKRILLWTTNKVHAGGVVTKVGAYTSACD